VQQENWFMYDNKRQGFNPDNELVFHRLKPNDEAETLVVM
jgi:hypothetical protein